MNQFLCYATRTPMVTDIKPRTDKNKDAKFRGIAPRIDLRRSSSDKLFFLAKATLYILSNRPNNPNIDNPAPPQTSINIMAPNRCKKHYCKKLIRKLVIFTTTE